MKNFVVAECPGLYLIGNLSWYNRLAVISCHPAVTEYLYLIMV